MNLIEKENTDIVFIQEPRIVNNRATGITESHKKFAANDGRCRAATVIINTHMDGLLIKELTDKDTVVVEIIYINLKFYSVNMYLDSKGKIENDLIKPDNILQYTSGNSILITMDSNSRSSTWHDTQTNERGREMEEFLITRQLFIHNEKSELTTFQSSRGKSNVDLTISNGNLFGEIKNWKISEEESCSDNRILQFSKGQNKLNEGLQETRYTGIKYRTKDKGRKKYLETLHPEVAKQVCGEEQEQNTHEIDSKISTQVQSSEDTEDVIGKFSAAQTAACNKTFKVSRPLTKTNSSKHRTVPWWNDELTITRKKVNATRIRYQRTLNDNDFREQRKTLYF